MKDVIIKPIVFFIKFIIIVMADALLAAFMVLTLGVAPVIILVAYLYEGLNSVWLLLYIPWIIVVSNLAYKHFSEPELTDPYLTNNASYKRLMQEYAVHKSLVVAFDFDNTVFDYHKEGHTYLDVIGLLKDLKSIGCYLICFTANDDNERIAKYLTDNKIPFDSINENPPFFKCGSGKIYYNVLLDDRAGLIQVFQELTTLVERIRKDL